MMRIWHAWGQRFCRSGLAALSLIAAAATLPLPGMAQDAAAPAAAVRSDQNGSAVREAAALAIPASVTEHRFDEPPHSFAYTATAGTLEVSTADGEPQAHIFHIAYVQGGGGDRAPGRDRPVTFLFNGGPGASSVYLHLGGVGPRSIAPTQGPGQPTDATLFGNAHSWLAFTDLVFVDPVGTGWSRAVSRDADAQKALLGVAGDLDLLARFVQLWLVRNQRIGSPIVLAGESYGGFRVGRLAEELETERGLDLAGVIMVSPALDFALLEADDHDLLPWVVTLPSIAASALERAGSLSIPALGPIEQFARTTYLTALAAPRGAPEGIEGLYDRLAELSGLPRDVVARQGGRFPIVAYTKACCRAERRIASLYDAATTMPDPYPWSPNRRGPDPLLQGLTAILATAMAHYGRQDLGVSTDRPYRVLVGDIAGRWDYGRPGRAGTDAVDALREVLAVDPTLRLLIMHGVTDLVTPYYASVYLAQHLPAQDRVQVRLYHGGHMMYLRADARAAMAADAAMFYAALGHDGTTPHRR